MSQVTVTTTSPPVIVWYEATVHHYDIYTRFNLWARQHRVSMNVVLLSQLILRKTVRGCVGLTTMLQQQQPQSQMPSQAYTNNASGSPWYISVLEFSLPPVPYVMCWCELWWLLSGFCVAAVFTSGGSTVGVCDTASFLSILLADISASWWWSVAHTRSGLRGCSSQYFE